MLSCRSIEAELPMYRKALVILFTGLAAALALSTSSQAATGPQYTITDLGTLGGPGSGAAGLNDRGDVVGWSNRSDGRAAGFLYSGGVMREVPLRPTAINDNGDIVGQASNHAALYASGQVTDLGTLPGGAVSSAYAINNVGQVTGSSLRSGLGSGHDHAFLWTAGAMQDLGVLAPDYSLGQGINNQGDVVGGTTNPASASLHAFLFSGGVMRDLGTLGGRASQALGINDAGVIVGTASASNDAAHPFVYRNGVMTDLGFTGGFSQGTAWAINSHGDIVGDENHGTLPGDAFINTGGVSYDLNGLIPAGTGWVLHDAVDINESGQIVGTGSIGGVFHAYLLTPVRSTPPTVTPAVAGTLGGDGWYTSNVDVSWAVDGGGLPIDSKTGCDPVGITADTAGTTLTCTATSAGGSTTGSVTVKRDATPPVVTYSGNSGSYTVDQDVSIACAAADPSPGSGLDATTCAAVNAPAYTFGLGPHTLTATARDKAGNTGDGSTTFTVRVTASSLCALTVRFVQGSDRYQRLPAPARRALEQLASIGCRNLDALLDRSPRRTKVLAAYANLVDALARSGLLTGGQAAVLVQLSKAL
jgi:probable HAF family extracellular repeat protein